MFEFIKRFFGIESDAARRRKLYEEQLMPQSMRISRAKLLLYVPELHPEVEKITDPRHGCLLEWRLTESQRVAPKRSFFPKYFFREKRRHRLVLDDFGRRMVDLTDGKRSIRQISEALLEGTQYAPMQMEDAILSFVGQLVRRNVMTLAPPSGKKD